jgi:hypothetical protein
MDTLMNEFSEEYARAQLEHLFERLAPRIPSDAFSEAERNHAASVDILLGTLSSLIDQFDHALALFDHVAQNHSEDFQWQLIAASDAVMTTWNFGEALVAIQAAFRRSHTLLSALGGKNALKPIVGEFKAHFNGPNASLEQARNANSHYVAQIATQESRRSNSLPSGILSHRNLHIENGIARIEYSRQRRLHTLEISVASRDKLREFRAKMFFLFRPVSQALIQELRKPKDASPPSEA